MVTPSFGSWEQNTTFEMSWVQQVWTSIREKKSHLDPGWQRSSRAPVTETEGLACVTQSLLCGTAFTQATFLSKPFFVSQWRTLQTQAFRRRANLTKEPRVPATDSTYSGIHHCSAGAQQWHQHELLTSRGAESQLQLFLPPPGTEKVLATFKGPNF